MVLAVAFAAVLAGPANFDFYTFGPYRAEVPKPDTVLNYGIGERHTVFADQEKVVYSVAKAASDRVKVLPYGKSTEGRELKIVAVSSPENMARLDEIQREHRELALHPDSESAKAAVDSGPVIVWVNQCIHGDETASFESGMALVYTLAASENPTVTTMLKNAVVIVNPVYNPDGHERYVVAYNSIPNGNPEDGTYDRAIPGAFLGRGNHYRFDMNRDRISMSQAETRQEVAMFLQWNPQVYVDQHGQVETYFMPPVQQSVNVNVGRDRYNKWSEIFGRAAGTAFDQQGWTYYVRDSFDFYNVCYLDTHATLMGAIGLTHETDGGRLVGQRRADDTLLTLRDGVMKHFTSALAVIGSAAEHRQELLGSYRDFKDAAVSGKHAGKFQRVVLTSDDARELERLEDLLGRSGIACSWVDAGFKQATAHDYWSDTVGEIEVPAGSLIVDMAQSQGPLAKALLEPESDFEPDFLARQKETAKAQKEGRHDSELDGFEFYDSTAWSLPYAFSLKAWWCESTPKFKAADGPEMQVTYVASSVGQYLPYKDQSDAIFVAKALRSGLKVSVVNKQTKVGGATLEPGTFMFLAARNEAGFTDKLFEMAKGTGADLKPLATSFPDEKRYGPGSESVTQLEKPEIGVVFGGPGSLTGGPLWYLMEREFKLPFLSLTTGSLGRNLDRFSCIVVPEGVNIRFDGRLREWVEDGGCLVSLGAAGWAMGKDSAFELKPKQGATYLTGSIFRAEIDAYSPLSYGYPRNGNNPIPLAVPIDGNSFWGIPEGGSPVSLVQDDKVRKLLSGWSWDETEKDVSGTAWLVEAQVGGGRVVMFQHDPSFRAQWPGLNKLLLNTMLMVPAR